MTSYCSKTLILFLFPLFAFSQVVDDIIAQPALNVSWMTGNRWSFNTAVEQRNSTTDSFNPLHIQAAQFASYEIGFYSQIGVGVMYRELFDNTAPEEVRFTEQYAYARKYNALKIAHRVRWDQRLREQRVTHRWRYLLSSSLPLNGFKTDASELYLTAGLETLFIAERGIKPGFDQRFYTGIGKKLNSQLRLQFITEYRFENFTQNTERLLFLNFGVYYAIE